MGRCKDLRGKKFGRLVVVKRVENYISPKGKKIARWLCKCDCGNYIKTTTNHLTSGDAKSCGCISIENILKASKSNITHGQTGSRIYRIWKDMKTRCFNPNFPNFKYYGEKGIGIYKPWLKNFQEFYNWAINNGYKENLTLDRINGSKNYDPNNCRWVTMKEQNLNKKNNVKIVYKNKEITLYELSKETNISQWALYKRYKRGDRGEKLIKPIKKVTKEVNVLELKDFLKMQKQLGDTLIEGQHKREPENPIGGKELLTNTLLGLQVEVSELAQTTRCFKYWSTKPPEDKERILEEYADVFHMMLCFANQMGFTEKEIEDAYLKKNQVNYKRQQEGY